MYLYSMVFDITLDITLRVQSTLEVTVAKDYLVDSLDHRFMPCVLSQVLCWSWFLSL